MSHLNTDYFDQIYYKYHAEVFAFLYSKVRCNYMAEEVLQLTFIKFWKIKETVENDIEVRIQIFQIAKTVLIDELRKKYNKKNSVHLTASDHNYQKESSYDHMGHQLYYNDVRLRVEKLLRAMPPMRKKVFVMSRFEEFSHKEIANLLNISIKTVENHITQALKHLKLNWCLLLIISLEILRN